MKLQVRLSFRNIHKSVWLSVIPIPSHDTDHTSNIWLLTLSIRPLYKPPRTGSMDNFAEGVECECVAIEIQEDSPGEERIGKTEAKYSGSIVRELNLFGILG